MGPPYGDSRLKSSMHRETEYTLASLDEQAVIVCVKQGGRLSGRFRPYLGSS